MKPCSNHRKLIAWLASGALDARQERGLRAHLETCAGCRGYLKEISNVTEKLTATAIRSEIETSESFHRKVVSALRAEQTPWETVVTQFQAALSNWRVALPVIGAIVVVIAAWSILGRRPNVPLPAPRVVQTKATVTPAKSSDLNPTLWNYQMVASRSLDKLDELLTSQGNRNPSPTPIYTASTLSRASALD